MGEVGLGGEGVYIMDTGVKRAQVYLRRVVLVRVWSRSEHTLWIMGSIQRYRGWWSFVFLVL